MGNLRFQLPQALPPYNTSFSALESGPACPQWEPATQSGPSGLPEETENYLASLLVNALTSAEDCACISSLVQFQDMVVIDDIGLTLNVITPADATPESKLPVIVVSFEDTIPILTLFTNIRE